MNSLIPWRRKHKAESTVARLADHPFAELQQRMNDLFADFFGSDLALPRLDGGLGIGSTAALPTFDVAETDAAIEVRAELPGMDEKDIEVQLDDNILTIRGEKKDERTEKKKNYYLSECRYGAFQRAVPLPAGIDRNAVKAAFKKGVLKITLPKTADARKERHRIAIESG